MWDKIILFFKATIIRLTFRGEPSPECWVFSSVHNKNFNYNSRYLFLYVREHCKDIRPYFVMNDPKERKKLEEEYGAEYFIDGNTAEGIRKILSCQVWFTSTAPPLYGVGLRKKYRIYNLWHGIPLKRIGMEQQNLSRLTRLYYKYFFADNYQAVLTTSSRLIPIMSRSFLVPPDRIWVGGQPRNDVLFQPQEASAVFQRLFPGEKIPGFHKVLLYAPTFRDRVQTRLFPFPEFEKDLEKAVSRLENWLEKEQIMLFIRLHLYDRSSYDWLTNRDREGSRIRFLNEDRLEDIMEILNVFDLLITDYSSIYIDYLLTGKPMVFLPYDQETYLKERGLNFPYDQVTPGPKPKSFSEFLNSIQDLLYNSCSYAQQRKEMTDFFHEIQEPCCEKLCDAVKKDDRR